MNLIKILKIIGLISALGYMIPIILVWIFANIRGHTYFSAGEPILIIKYFEWILGTIGIFIIISYLKQELDTIHQ